MNILVIGATGMIGAEVVSGAAGRGHQLVAASLNASASQSEYVTPLILDIHDETTLNALAQHGSSEAVATLGTVNGFVIRSETGLTVYVSGDTVPFESTDMIRGA